MCGARIQRRRQQRVSCKKQFARRVRHRHWRRDYVRQSAPRFKFGRHGCRVRVCSGGRRAEDVPWCRGGRVDLRQLGKAGAEKITDGSGCAIPDQDVSGIMVGMAWAMPKQPGTAQAGRVVSRAVQTQSGPVCAADQPVFKAMMFSPGVDSCHLCIAVRQPCLIAGSNQHSGKYRNFGL